MTGALRNRANKKAATGRMIALALLICFISVSLLSGAFILTHADHEHDHNGVHGLCSACALIQNAENALKFFGTAAALGFAAFAVQYAAATLIGAVFSKPAALTPITAKIRMNK